MCPLAALRALASYGRRLAALSVPVFRLDQNSDQAVSRTTLACRLSRRLRSLGVTSSLFGLHSFRIGGATAAAMAGLPERVLKAHGRWRSDVVRKYMRDNEHGLWETTRKMLSAA